MRGLDLLNFVDEIYDAFEPKRASSPTYPIVFIEERPIIRPTIRGHRRWNPLMPVKTLAQKEPNNTISTASENDFQAVFDISSSFKPEEISVKIVERDIVVEGKHEEREDEHGFISRQFTRRFTLPKDFDSDSVTTYLDKNGKMTIKALKLKPIEPKERIIPIKRISDENEEQLSSKKSKTLSNKDANEENEKTTVLE